MLLAGALAAAGQAELAGFYEELAGSEARHYRVYVDLAASVAGDRGRATARLAEIAREEGEMNDTLGRAAAVHG